MYMEDEQFALLCKNLGFDKGSLTYSDFIESFEDMRVGGPGQEITRTPNHWWKKLDGHNMSAKEMLANLGDKMRQAFGVSWRWCANPNLALKIWNKRKIKTVFKVVS